MKTLFRVAPAALVAALVACSGSDGANALVSVSDEPAGASCADGGLRIETGLDDNGNGMLDAAEVDGTSYVCDGEDGTSGTEANSQLVRVLPEPAGANCPNGGDRVDFGLDDNGNGNLDSSEVESTTYICDGVDAAQSLVSVTAEPAGGNCAEGGQRIDYGVDDDGDAALEAGEVDGTTYVCNGGTGSTSLVSVTDEASGANCPFGGVQIRHGIDDNGNGTLDTVEVDGTEYVCNGGTEQQFTAFAASYTAQQTFTIAPVNIRSCGLAWDGASIWSCGLGTASGNVQSQYSSSYAFVSYYQPNIDFRAMFTKGDGASSVYSRAISSQVIRRQTAPGTWVDDVTLASATVDSQANVHWDNWAREFISFNAGTLSRWSESGTHLGDVTFTGWGSLNSENTYPNNRGVVWAGGVYMTYSNGVLSAWSKAGTRLGTTTLTGAGTSTDAHFSLAYARGLLWIADGSTGSWRGFDVIN